MDLLLDLNELNKYFEFDKLILKDKLQILCDIVRQSIYPNGHPNPENDIENMNGNCYTSSYVYLNYLKKLNIGLNPRCVIARKRCFDLPEVTSIHVIVLVESSDGHIFQVDTTPFAGYKYGFVEDITYNKIYDDCVPINDDINRYLYIFRKIIYDNFNNIFDYNNISHYYELCNIFYDYPILKGYVAMILKIISSHLINKNEKNRIQSIINSIKPYNSNNLDNMSRLKSKFNIQLKKWYEELYELKGSYVEEKRILELGINIVQEGKWFDKNLNRYAYINSKKIYLSNINPRYLYENDYKTYFVRNKDINKYTNCISKYVVSLDNLKSQLGLNVLSFSNLKNFKLDDDFSVILCGKNDFLDNSIYESSSYSESSLNYLLLYPEHHVMTKFMKKNPKLRKR